MIQPLGKCKEIQVVSNLMELRVILETFKLRTNMLLLKHVIVRDPPKSTALNKLIQTTPSRTP